MKFDASFLTRESIPAWRPSKTKKQEILTAKNLTFGQKMNLFRAI